jgi:hypothetical protein
MSRNTEQRSGVLRRRLAIVAAVVGAVLVLSLAMVAGDEFLAVDKCLDRGGAFDYQSRRCDVVVQRHVYVPFSDRHGKLLLAGKVGAVMLVVAGGLLITDRLQSTIETGKSP